MENLSKQSQYSLDYLKNVTNRDNSNNNNFMSGQLECANHSMNVISELLINNEDLNKINILDKIEILLQSGQLLSFNTFEDAREFMIKNHFNYEPKMEEKYQNGGKLFMLVFNDKARKKLGLTSISSVEHNLFCFVDVCEKYNMLNDLKSILK